MLSNTSTHTDIENAVNNAAARAAGNGNVQQVVLLSPGTFLSLGGQIRLYSPSYVTLRGAGRGSTILPYVDGPFKLGNSPYLTGAGGWPAGVNITSGATIGSTTVVLSATTNIAIGQMMHLQVDNTGGIYGFGNGNGTTQTSNSSGILRDNAAVRGIDVMVTGISGLNVTFSPSLNMNLGGGKAYGWNGTQGAISFGLENLSLTGATNSGAIAYWIEGCYATWTKNVEIKNWDGINEVFRCVNCEMTGCYTHDANSFSINNGYALNIDHNTNCLWQGNIFYYYQDGVTLEGSSTGNVFGYNVFFREYYGPSPGTQLGSFSNNHMPYAEFNLFEGNYTNSYFADYWYGPSGNNTLLRNYIAGCDPDSTSNLICVDINSHQWNYNVVGNILGTKGTSPSNQITLGLPGVTLAWANHTTLSWIYGAAEQTNWSTGNRIFRLGYPNLGNQASSGWKANPNNVGGAGGELQWGDTDVQASAASPALDGNYTLIHANWDKANGSQTFDSSIADHVVPNSLYLSDTDRTTLLTGLAGYDPTVGEAADPATALKLIPAGYELVTGSKPTPPSPGTSRALGFLLTSH
jgi:hypothetical protein